MTKAKGKTKVIVVINQKGGVGKSTLSFHLVHAAAEFGKNGKPAKVLVLDMDSQADLSLYLTGDLDIKQRTKSGVGLLLEGAPVADAMIPLLRDKNLQVDLLHGHKKLDRYDDDEDVSNRAYELRSVLDDLGYDIIIIDTPPALGLRHLAPMVWADLLVIPMEPVLSSISRFQDVLETVEESVSMLNPSLKWLGVVNRMNKSVASHRAKEAFIHKTYGLKNVPITFTSRTAVSDAMEDDPAIPVWRHRKAPRELRDLWLNACRKLISAA